MSKRRFEMVEGTSSKFWEIEIVGTEVRTTYGRIGTSGQTTIKAEGSAEGARKLYEKLVKEKTAKGYAEIGGGAPAATAPKAAPKKAFDLFARLTELAAVDAVDEDGDDLLALADLEVLATEEMRENEMDTDLFDEVKMAPKGSLVPVILHGSGSLVLGWKPDAKTPMRPVWVDSEGEPRAVFGASMEEMFQLVPHGLGYLYDCIMAAQRGTAHAKASDCDAEAWTAAGFSPHPSPGAAVLAAYRTKPEFSEWLQALAEGDDEGEGGDEGSWRRFEVDEKFWAIKLDGASHTVRFGKIGTNGQEKTKDFDDEEAAKTDYDKLVAEKTKKGYEPVDG